MHKSFSLLAFLLFSLPISILAQTKDSIKIAMPIHDIRQHYIDIQDIKLDLSFSWEKKQAKGTATITLVPTKASKTIFLDAAQLDIHAVTLKNGKKLTYQSHEKKSDDALEITLDRVYKANESIVLIIDYHTNWVNESDPNNLGGSNGKGIRFFEPTFTEPRKRKQIWSMANYQSNRYWFPGYDGLDDVRTTEFRATVDKGFMAISNGELVKKQQNADGTTSFHWKMDKPYPNYQTAFVVGEYVDIEQKYKDISLHNYSYPDEQDGTRASIERLPDMVKFFSELTGVKYPYPTYSQVFVQDLPWGMESANLSIQTENMVDDFGTHVDFLYLWDGLEAEGLANQWFGTYLSCKDWADIWLNKSFAHYLDGLYTEYKNGRAEYLLYYQPYDMNTLYLSDWEAGQKRPIVTQVYENRETLVNDNYARRGALVLRMLEKELGKEKWTKALQYYVRTYANQSVCTQDLIKAIEHTTGEKVSWFFDQWIYKMGHPIFTIQQSYDEKQKQLTLTLQQTQTKDTNSQYPQVDFFKGKMDIEIDGEIHTINLVPKAFNSFTFSLEKQPQLVHIDYENVWIKEFTFQKDLTELLYQFKEDTDITGRQWAMTELVVIAQNEQTTKAEKAQIYQAYEQVIQQKLYWRFRTNALFQYRSIIGIPTEKATIEMLLAIIKDEKYWLRSSAITFLGMTKDPKYTDIYLKYLNDSSDRVVNAAAIALGKTKSPQAFDALCKLKDKPSWKNQSLISCLNGLKELGDERGFTIALAALKDSAAAPRWTLATPIWDFRIAAAQTLLSLGKEKEAYTIVYQRFKESLKENEINDIFSNVLLISILGDESAQDVFALLKTKYKDDANAMLAVNQYETQWKDKLKK